MVYEIPMYRFRRDVPFEQALAASRALDAFLDEMPGFRRRLTIHDATQETWIDVVEWESMEQAHAAMEAFPRSEAFAAFADLADPTFELLHHGVRVHEHVAGAVAA